MGHYRGYATEVGQARVGREARTVSESADSGNGYNYKENQRK